MKLLDLVQAQFVAGGCGPMSTDDFVVNPNDDTDCPPVVVEPVETLPIVVDGSSPFEGNVSVPVTPDYSAIDVATA